MSPLKSQPNFAGLAVELRARPFEPADLDGAALVFVADHGPDGDAAKAEARSAAIPLNVVDVPGECDFYTPSIVDRAPLTVAMSTEGDAPVLARLVRARIEAMLSPETRRGWRGWRVAARAGGRAAWQDAGRAGSTRSW